MPELDFGRTNEDAILVLKGVVRKLHVDAYGNGKKGYFQMIDEREAIERERHRSNTTRLNVIIALSSLAVAILTALGILVTIQAAHHTALNSIKIFTSDASGQEYDASNKEYAGPPANPAAR